MDIIEPGYCFIVSVITKTNLNGDQFGFIYFVRRDGHITQIIINDPINDPDREFYPMPCGKTFYIPRGVQSAMVCCPTIETETTLQPGTYNINILIRMMQPYLTGFD